MTTLDPCPDDLLARASDTPLAPNERAQLVGHAARCPSCRAAMDAAAAFRAEPIAFAGDDVLVARLAARATGGVSTRRPRVPSAPMRAATIAAIFLGIGGAAAALWTWRSPRRHAALEAPPAVVPPPTAAAAPLAAAVVPTPAPTRTLAATATPEIPVAPHPPRFTATSQALLKQARAARATGERARALELYRRVERRFRGTPAAAVADIAIGTLLLDEGRDPRGALAAFDRYLVGERTGSLREEALVGRARALEALGETPDGKALAVAAWRALIDAYPGSLHKAHAQRRIDALAASP